MKACNVSVGQKVKCNVKPCCVPFGTEGKVKSAQWIPERGGKGWWMIGVTWKMKSKETKTGFRSWTVGGFRENDLKAI